MQKGNKMQIRVLHFVTNMDRGGQETLIMNLYRNMDRDRFQFCFLCSSKKTGHYDKEIAELGGILYYLPERVKRHGLMALADAHTNVLLLKEWLLANQSKFDCVHLHTSHAADVLVHLMACKLAGVDNVIVHSHNTQAPHPLYHKICRFLTTLFKFKRLACGERAAEWMYGKKLVLKGVITILHNGIDANRFVYNPGVARLYKEQLGIADKTVYGHVGRFVIQKNHSFLIDVFYEIQKIQPESVLMLIGDGELKKEMVAKVKRLGIDKKVLFMGVRDDVPLLLSAMDLFLFPSFHEGLSVAAIEVQCNGLPCLSSDIPAMREAKITPLLSFRSLKDSPEQWAKSALSIAQRNVEMDTVSLIKAAQYDIKQSVEIIEKVYVQLVNNKV